MSKLSDQLRERGIINTHDLLCRFGVAGKDVAVAYYPAAPREMRPACSRVYSPSHKTDPGAHFRHHGAKAFLGARGESFALAIEWASATYGITSWAPDPTDPTARVPKYVRDAAEKLVRA